MFGPATTPERFRDSAERSVNRGARLPLTPHATDGDWSESAAFIEELGVQVEQLCPHLPQIQAGGKSAPITS